MKSKKTFRTVLAGFSIVIMVLPLLATTGALLTRFLDNWGFYQPIEKFIVPWQARMVAVAITPFGIESRIVEASHEATFYMVKGKGAIPVDLSWNCLGWQSVLLLAVSLFAGLRGNFSFFSRFKCVALGLVGTLLVNVLRMSLIALGIYYINSFVAQIIHDYLAALFTLFWLLFFWWFSYKYLLEEKKKSKPLVLPKTFSS